MTCFYSEEPTSDDQIWERESESKSESECERVERGSKKREQGEIKKREREKREMEKRQERERRKRERDRVRKWKQKPPPLCGHASERCELRGINYSFIQLCLVKGMIINTANAQDIDKQKKERCKYLYHDLMVVYCPKADRIITAVWKNRKSKDENKALYCRLLHS